MGTEEEGECEVGYVMRGVIRVGEEGRCGTRESELLVSDLVCALAEARVEERIGTWKGMCGGTAAISLRVRIDSKTDSMVDANASCTFDA